MQYKLKIRIFINQDLENGSLICLDEKQKHYLINVMRCSTGDTIYCFDNKNGEFACQIQSVSKKECILSVKEKTKDFSLSPDLWLLFAPIKKEPSEMVVQKATELGVRKIIPVTTDQTVNHNLRPEKLQLQAVEAAEQSRRLDVPKVEQITTLKELLNNWDKDRHLFVLNESGVGESIYKTFEKNKGKAAVLIGPEGGFSKQELETFEKFDFIKSVFLGSRILKAETAAFAAISCWQAVCGDWQ